jgi:hypothetical protein
MGGKRVLRVAAQESPDILDSLLAPAAHGDLRVCRLQQLLHERHHSAFEIEVVRCPPVRSDQLIEQFVRSPQTMGADLVVLSLIPELSGSQRNLEGLLQLIRVVKEGIGAHVIVYNCSPLDPDDQRHNYHGVADTLSVAIHRLNLALMYASMEEGISILDVERLVAEVGASQVLGALRYADEAQRSIGQEFLRIVEDIGFFEERPLVLQVGQRRS